MRFNYQLGEVSVVYVFVYPTSVITIDESGCLLTNGQQSVSVFSSADRWHVFEQNSVAKLQPKMLNADNGRLIFGHVRRSLNLSLRHIMEIRCSFVYLTGAAG